MPTGIEWCDETWNPVTGCDRVSPGCDHCYALTMAKRLKAMGSERYQNDGDPRTSGPGFGLTVHPDALDQPLRWKRPRRIFVNSMSDLFHKDVPDEFIVEVFDTMMNVGRHTYQVLTKRPQRMAQFVAKYTTGGFGLIPDAPPVGALPSRIWLGTSIENNHYAWRANHLRMTPAAVRFLSLEPLLGPLPSLNLDGIDWVIVGGESGPGARPMHPDWVRDMRDRCVDAGVAFHFKQWGAWVAPGFIDAAGMDDVTCNERGLTIWPDGRTSQLDWGTYADDSYRVWHMGKHGAGRVLDGRTWDQWPKTEAAA